MEAKVTTTLQFAQAGKEKRNKLDKLLALVFFLVEDHNNCRVNCVR